MKTTAELNAEILSITITIGQYYPELSKYIVEMPFSSHTNYNETITLRNLYDYYSSLKSLVLHYAVSHRASSVAF